ncbi:MULTISPECIES: molecular chaperone [unclassified Serratia (in: enterobacteria)]|uniref:fimbrial biogenesis chaperone n=1 Tax=unclassified Serratia (in: enterobacteria) TaxID=2647522 RepID=UPI003B43AF0D
MVGFQRVVFAVGSTIKLFYRTAGLPSSASEVAKTLRFTRAGGQVRAENRTPYYVSLMTLNINGGAIKIETGKSDMVAPFGTASWAVGAPYPMSQAGKVSWAAMVNLGEVVNGSATLQ